MLCFKQDKNAGHYASSGFDDLWKAAACCDRSGNLIIQDNL